MGPWQKVRRVGLVHLAAAIWCLATCSPAGAQVQVQVRQSYPRVDYYTAKRSLYNGRLLDARNDAAKLSGQARNNPTPIGFDAICYDALLGECLYQAGDLDGALVAYRSALNVAVRFPNWLDRIKFGDLNTIQPRGAAAAFQTPWGTPKSAAVLGKFPDTMIFQQGDPNTLLQLPQGGGTRLGQFIPVDVIEIIRCTSLASRRMGDLLGSLAEDDDSLKAVLSAVSRRPGPTNHWSEAWVDLMIGSALFGSGKYAQARPHLQKAELVMGRYVHPLTAEAQFLLGRIAWESGDAQAAGVLFEEASRLALADDDFPDLTVLEESIRWAYAAHVRVNGAAAPYLLPGLASAWLQRENWDFIAASAAASDIDVAASGGANVSPRVRAATRRLRGAYPAVQARMSFSAARSSINSGAVDEAREHLALAVDRQAAASTALLKIRVVDDAFRRGTLTALRAMELYELALAAPDAADWAANPLDCIVRLVTDKSAYYARWYAACLNRSKAEEAFDVVDRARRDRFLGTTLLGGRLLWLRHALTAPLEAIDSESAQYRTGVFAQAPRLAAIDARTMELRRQLDLASIDDLVGDDPEVAEHLNELASLAAEQELLLRQISLERVASPRPTPAIVTVKQVQRALAPGQAVLSFAVAGTTVTGFLVTPGGFESWSVESSAAIPAKLAAYLNLIGLTDANREIDDEVLADESWREAGAALLRQLLSDEAFDQIKGVSELTIVPDGYLWYMPFESLCVPVEGEKAAGAEAAPVELTPLIAKTAIRYIPTVGFAIPDQRGRRRGGNLGLVVGKLHPQEDNKAVDRTRAAWAATAPQMLELSSRERAGRFPTRAMTPFIHRLVIDEDIPPLSDSYDFSVMRIGLRNQVAASSLLECPWGAPEVVVAPGFHTAAERALGAGGSRRPPTGDDVFLPATTLLAAGSQTILFSRWRTGGDSARDMMRSFVGELGARPPAEVWRDVVLASWERELDPDVEPRLRRRKPGAPAVTAAHPFFWAGYALVDRAVLRPTDEIEEEAAEGVAP